MAAKPVVLAQLHKRVEVSAAAAAELQGLRLGRRQTLKDRLGSHLGCMSEQADNAAPWTPCACTVLVWLALLRTPGV